MQHAELDVNLGFGSLFIPPPSSLFRCPSPRAHRMQDGEVANKMWGHDDKQVSTDVQPGGCLESWTYAHSTRSPRAGKTSICTIHRAARRRIPVTYGGWTGFAHTLNLFTHRMLISAAWGPCLISTGLATE